MSAAVEATAGGRMNGLESEPWLQANQRHVTAAIAVVRATIENHGPQGPETSGAERMTRMAQARSQLEEAEARMPAPPALHQLRRLFGLSAFERDVLLLCAGVELDATFAAAWASPGGAAREAPPTFGLALAAFPEPHWSALLPSSPLRFFRLIEMSPGSTLSQGALRIDERVLHFLVGASCLDERAAGVMMRAYPARLPLPASHRVLAQRIASALTDVDAGPMPAVALVGPKGAGRRAIALAACAALQLDLHVLSSSAFAVPADVPALARTLDREAILGRLALLVDVDDLEPGDAARRHALFRLVDEVAAPVFIATRSRLSALHRPVYSVDVRNPGRDEQRTLWLEAIARKTPPTATNGHSATSSPDSAAEALVRQFDLGAAAIDAACLSAQAARFDPSSEGSLVTRLWNACRAECRPLLDELSQRIEPRAGWDDLVLPEAQRETLREIAIHVRHRICVYENWGFAAKGERGLGVTALFSGASGTGKTMAAEVIARELQIDLYRVDLSEVVSKYIGETEKNLRRIFDAAEHGAAVLLFDEADALFGRRSEVKDSHDRFANLEVSYLLQRLEAFRGLAVLTTNLKSAIDPAFLRRVRFVVQFPFPGAAERLAMWRRAFPANTPTEGLDVAQLAKMNIAGGNIRNVALNAAFLAAQDAEPVRMKHVMRAARSEYSKLERPLTAAEGGG